MHSIVKTCTLCFPCKLPTFVFLPWNFVTSSFDIVWHTGKRTSQKCMLAMRYATHFFKEKQERILMQNCIFWDDGYVEQKKYIIEVKTQRNGGRKGGKLLQQQNLQYASSLELDSRMQDKSQRKALKMHHHWMPFVVILFKAKQKRMHKYISFSTRRNTGKEEHHWHCYHHHHHPHQEIFSVLKMMTFLS